MVADEVLADRLPEEISREILKYYLPRGNTKNADIATSSGYRQNLKRDALRPQPSAAIPSQPPGSSASDALGGRTRRRRRHNKRKTRKSKKYNKRRPTKRR